jgi:hypothetical protein
MRNRAGIIERLSTGTDEVICSNVTVAESGRKCGLGRAKDRTGDMPAPFWNRTGYGEILQSVLWAPLFIDENEIMYDTFCTSKKRKICSLVFMFQKKNLWVPDFFRL